MKQRILIIFIILLTSKSSKSQFISGAKFTALANASVALQDIWSANANASGLNQIKNVTGGISYENRFSVSELSGQAAIIAIPFKNYIVGINFQNYGIQEFGSIKSGMSLTKNFGSKFSTAIRLNYHRLHIENYESEMAFSVDCGMQVQVASRIRLGAHIANPNQSSFKRIQDQSIESHIRFGGFIGLSDKLSTCAEIEKSNNKSLDYKMGIDYQIANFFALRGGISVNSFRQYGGFGINHKSLAVDFAVSNHKYLGYSPQLALAYEF